MNHPRIRIAKDMKECIYQIEHYVWDDFKGGVEQDPKEKPKNLNTHFPDLFHYFALSNFGWTRPKMSQGTGNFYS